VNDKDLAAAILAGDDAAKTQLYHQCYRKLYVTAAHFLGSADAEIEDTVHDTFIKGFDALAEFRFQASLATWLNHICVNLCFDRLRQRKRQLLAQEEELEQATRSMSQKAHQLQGQKDEAKERAKVVQRHLMEMGEPCRSILELRRRHSLLPRARVQHYASGRNESVIPGESR